MNPQKRPLRPRHRFNQDGPAFDEMRQVDRARALVDADRARWIPEPEPPRAPIPLTIRIWRDEDGR